eukprot:scaffold65263_cov50-Phaeocystis_antarctica.AAC.3
MSPCPPPRSSVAAWPLQPSAPPPAPPASAPRKAPPPRRWRRSPGLGLAELVVHTKVARLVIGLQQRQPLHLRLLPRLLARQRRRHCSPLRRRLPLRRPRDAQRRLLGRGEAAQAHHLATAPQLRLVGLGPARLVEVHAEVARLSLGHAQRQPLRLRLLPRLLARQHRCGPLRRRLPLRRSRDAQRRLLGGGEVAQAHLLTIAPHPGLVGFREAGIGEVHTEVARLIVGHAQRQPLRLRLRSPHQRSPTRRDRGTR